MSYLMLSLQYLTVERPIYFIFCLFFNLLLNMLFISTAFTLMNVVQSLTYIRT